MGVRPLLSRDRRPIIVPAPSRLPLPGGMRRFIRPPESAMADVTLQVLEGLERGRTFRNLAAPVTIGREEDNVVRLNDERVSRFHAKIQEDAGRIILTDLESTNGTRVNGRPISARVLRPGDQISVGRCLLAFGSREELDRLIAGRRDAGGTRAAGPGGGDPGKTRGASPAANEPAFVADEPGGARPFFPPGVRPPVPADLELAQRAELCDLLGFVHEELLRALQEGTESAPLVPGPAGSFDAAALGGDRPGGNGPGGEAAGGSSAGGSSAGMPAAEPDASDPGVSPPALDSGLSRTVPWSVWQRLLRLEMDLAESLRAAAEPG